jgi:hypothetical protein
MKRKFWPLALVGAVLLSGTVAWADSDFYVIAAGPTAVGTKITTVPYTISNPGFYYLTGNLTYSGTPGNAITVNASHVTIDLMGFSLTNAGDLNAFGIYMSGKTNVEVRNGTVRSFAMGIREDSNVNGGNHRVINVRAEANLSGISLAGYGHIVKGCTAANNTYGIEVVGGNISGNVLNNNKIGIALQQGTISGNTVLNAAAGSGTGIGCAGTGSIIGNTVTCNTGQTGINAGLDGLPVLVDQNSVGGEGTHYERGSGTNMTSSNAG